MSARNTFRFALVALPVSLLLAGAGCGKKGIQPQDTGTDLSKTMDIFQRPVPPVQQVSPTTVVATVDGTEITALQLQAEIGGMIARIRNRVPPEQLAQLQPRIREQALDQVIARTLLAEAADRENIVATTDDLAEAREKITSGLPDGVTIDDVLTQRNLTPEQFEKEISEEIRINKLLEKATADVGEVSDEDLQAYYDENKERFEQPELVTARHILIATDPQDTDEQKAEKRDKAEKIRERLVAGEDFAEVAQAETDDPGSRDTGGLYGPFPRGQMVPPFDEAAFSQPTGEIGQLVETRFGYHIIKVEKHDQAREVPLAEVRTNLAAFLRSKKMQEAAQEYIGNLRSNAQVDIIESP